MSFKSTNDTAKEEGSRSSVKPRDSTGLAGLGEKVKPTSAHRSCHMSISGQKSQTPRASGGNTLDDFEVICTIGSGSYATCKKIRRKKDGKVLVWKELDYGAMTEGEKQMLVSEVNLLRELQSPYIVRYYDRIIDRSRTTIYIIMEYCKGGDLSTVISKCKRDSTYLDEEFIWKILVQVTMALQECHQRKNGKAVLHRDMKPANVFLDTDRNVKLGDFGLARVLHHETSFANTYVGTPYYMSPELVNNMSYNEKSDVWSMGCMLYELCALHPPFTASNQIELNRKIRLGECSRIPLRYTDDLNQAIFRMLQVEVSKRPTIEELLRLPAVSSRRGQQDRKHTASGHSSSPPSDLQGWEAELRALEKQLEQKKRELDSRERELDLKEKLVADKDKCASVREKLADEKFSRAESLLQEYERKMRLDTERLLRGEREFTSASDLSGDALASCLTRKKDPDTPKKKVSFDMYGKENERMKEKYPDPRTKYNDYDSMYIQELLKRQELKDRLHKVQTRAIEYRSAGAERSKSRNLLLFR